MLIIAEIGTISLIFALVICLGQGVNALYPFSAMGRATQELPPNYSSDNKLIPSQDSGQKHVTPQVPYNIVTNQLTIAWRLTYSWATFVIISFIILGYLFVSDDFTVRYVLMNSNKMLATVFKLTAIWGGHEGSLLLWISELAIWTVGVSFWLRQHLSSRSQIIFQVWLAGIAGCFIVFILSSSNPFGRILTYGLALGQDLNPLLQDPGMISHPPLLYSGYVGMAIIYAITMTMLASYNERLQILNILQPIVKITWIGLTIGITLGSAWAYRQLGWGGWWFWDPVENSSLMPWLVVTVLLHILAGPKQQRYVTNWVIIAGILGFALSILGTFLVRSGVLVSVHSFAQDPRRGALLLGWLVVQVGLSLGIYWRNIDPTHNDIASNSGSDKHGKDSIKNNYSNLVSFGARETLIQLNNLLLALMLFTIALATLYPLVLQACGLARISIGAPYYNLIMRPMLWVMLLGMIVVPFSRWQSVCWHNDSMAADSVVTAISPANKQDPLGNNRSFNVFVNMPLMVILSMGVISGGLVWLLWLAPGSFLSGITCGLCLWVMLSMLVASIHGRGKQRAWRRRWIMLTAHTGFVIIMLSLVIASNYGQDKSVSLGINDEVKLAGHSMKLISVQKIAGSNYSGEGLLFADNYGSSLHYVTTELRYYPARSMWQPKVGLLWFWGHDFMVVAANKIDDQHWAVRCYYRPMLRWALFGVFLMVVAVGGGLVQRFASKNPSKEKT